jgi:hypothetical protein
MRRTFFAVIGAIVLTGGSGLAHHSYAEFQTDQTVSIEGDVEELLFVNPHVVLKVHAKDSHTYTAVWQAAYQLARTGVIRTTLNVGDHVIVSGSPARDSANYTLSLLKEVQRPLDGWRWSRQTAWSR